MTAKTIANEIFKQPLLTLLFIKQQLSLNSVDLVVMAFNTWKDYFGLSNLVQSGRRRNNPEVFNVGGNDVTEHSQLLDRKCCFILKFLHSKHPEPKHQNMCVFSRNGGAMEVLGIMMLADNNFNIFAAVILC